MEASSGVETFEVMYPAGNPHLSAGRKFFDAVKLNPRDQTSIRIVAQMDELFAIDARARQEDLSRSDCHFLRLEKSQSLLEQIKAGIQAARVGTLPKSALAWAVRN